MSRKYIQNLRENENVDDIFFVHEKTIGIGKTGKSYLSLKLGDKTGSMDGKIWDRIDQLGNNFDKEDFVRVKGITQLFQGSLQLVISDIKKITALESINIDDFMPDSGINIEKIWQEFLEMGRSLKNKYLNQLFHLFFIEPEIEKKFKIYPAAKSLHHAYKGGLLEHSLNVAKLSEMLCKYYNNSNINRDVLVFSALIHDLGKIKELDFSLVPSYTDEGKLLGHIILLDELVSKKADSIPGFPKDLLVYIRHVLLSHHGEYEFGSPKRPKVLEGLILHFLDNLDAKLNSFIFAIDRDNQQGNWTSVVKAFDRQLFKGKILYEEDAVNGHQKLSNKGFNTVLKNINFELFNQKE